MAVTVERPTLAPTTSRHRIREVAALTRRWHIEVVRERLNLVFSVAQPAVWLVFFGSAIGRAMDASVVGTDNYLGFVLPGIVAFTVVGNGVNGAMPLLWDKETGYLDRLMAMPIARSSVILSRFVYQALLGTAQIVGVFIVGLFMGISVAAGPIGVLLIIANGAMLTMSIAALLAALVYRVPGHGTFFAITGFVMMPLLFLSNAFVPLDVMPTWMAVLARINPLTYSIESMRVATVEGLQAGAFVSLGVSGLIALACLTLGTLEFRRQTGERV